MIVLCLLAIALLSFVRISMWVQVGLTLALPVLVTSSHSRCGRWVSWHLSPTSPVNVPATCALDLESLLLVRTTSGQRYNVRTSARDSGPALPVLPSGIPSLRGWPESDR